MGMIKTVSLLASMAIAQNPSDTNLTGSLLYIGLLPNNTQSLYSLDLTSLAESVVSVLPDNY